MVGGQLFSKYEVRAAMAVQPRLPASITPLSAYLHTIYHLGGCAEGLFLGLSPLKVHLLTDW